MASSANSSNGLTTENLEPSFFVPEYYTEPTGLVEGRLMFEATLAVVSVLGNIFGLRGHCKNEIGIADIGVLIVVFPMAVLQERAKTYFPLGRGICLYVYPVVDTFCGASIWLVTSVAIERYINIVKRVEVYRKLR